MINVGSNFPTSKEAVKIAQRYEKGVFAAVGLHPINLDTGLVRIKVDEKEGAHFEKEFDFAGYKELAQHEKVVAIGEVGLDYYWKPKTKGRLLSFKEKQRDLLLKELELSKELELPVIFHCRMGHDALIKILSENQALLPEKAVAHSFVGSLDQLQKYLNFGFHIGYNGIIFKKIEGIDFEEIIQNTPLERILVETDCPYLAPPEFVKERNEPIAIKYVAEKIAEIKKISFEKLATFTTKNAKKLFQI
jgi:TatD DNase family protein